MLRDVFYYGRKPNVHPREKLAKNLEDAREQSTTEHFWIVNEYCDYTGFDWDFDFDFLDDDQVWTQNHNNAWPSQHQKDSGTWLCPKIHSKHVVYRTDVHPIKRKNIKSEHWRILEEIDESTFDFSWHPDPTSPPYIYAWGCKYYPATHKPVVTYVVDDAKEYQYFDSLAEIKITYDHWHILENIDKDSFDFRWRPDPKDPPYIYVWGNQHYSAEIMPTLEYHTPGSTERKYIDSALWHVRLASEKEKFEILHEIESFDFSWKPNPKEPDYIHVFGNQHYSAEKMPTVKYVVPGAVEIKYHDELVAKLPNNKSKFTILDNVDENNFDFSWVPDPDAPLYIYVWGNKHVAGQIYSTIEYRVENATEKFFVHNDVKVLPREECWNIIDSIDKNTFDFTWRPNPTAPPYIYAWGNKHVDARTSSTIEYIVPGATEYKFMDELIKVLPKFENWYELQKIDRSKFDFTWRPNPKEPPYIYAWGNKFVPVEMQSTIEYRVPGATEYKYMTEVEVLPETERWVMHQQIDTNKFDLCWRPDPREPAYIYIWGNKWVPAELQPTLEYHCIGATEKKYMPEPIEVLPEKDRWTTVQEIDKETFDLSWRPDPREPAYIYVWGNKYIPGEVLPTLKYTVPNATEIKYMGNVDVLPELDRWKIYDTVDKEKFDMSWRPDPNEPPYIYVWGNEYVPGELEPTIEYHTPDATERKYMGNVPVTPQIDRWRTHIPVDTKEFDINWRPDPREPPYIYVWGNKHVPAELRPTIEYVVPGAITIKYMDEPASVLPNWDNYKIYHPTKDFDYTWMPDPREPPFIYVWGNKHVPGELQPTLEYHVPGAVTKKYMDSVDILPEWNKWVIDQQPIDFDFTWMPDPREPAYIYVWGNKYIPGVKRPTVTYETPGATTIKYMGDNLNVEPEWDKWKILIPVDKTSFDFSWRPDPEEPPFIYVWGNQSNSAEVEPTIEYYSEGIHLVDKPIRKYMSNMVAKTLPMSDNWEVLLPIEEFDFSWRPNPGAPPYIYVFGNQWNKAEVEKTVLYKVPGATEYNYIHDNIAKVSPVHEYWKILMPVENFDYSWRPEPHAPPYIYVFGNQWNPVELQHTLEYHVPGATEYKYMDKIANLKPLYNDSKWKNLISVEYFDYSWVPDPREPPLIYVFGNKWNDANTEPSVEYHMEGATERKYMPYPIATPATEMRHWSISNLEDLNTFDFSWRPNPHSPPQMYQWENNGPRYTVPGALDVVLMKRQDDKKNVEIVKYYIKTTLYDLIQEHPDEVFWALNPDLDYADFNFDWRPNNQNFRHVNVFGNETAKDTQTYYVNGPMYMLGYRDYNYVTDQKVEIKDTKLSIFFIDRNNEKSKERFEQLKKRYPDIIKTRFFNSWAETISRCIRKSKTNLFWIVNSEYDYTNFTFDFYPSPWQMNMIHVFGTQWSHWGQTYLINGSNFNNDTQYVKIIEHLGNLNFVKGKIARAIDCLYDVYLIDHGNKETTQIKEQLESKEIKNIITIPYTGSYLKTLKNIANKLETTKEHFIWVCSSVCDYENFDLSYICDPFAKDNLHVFASDKQKFGDTFLIDVNKLRELINDLNNLEEYSKVNYIEHIKAKRLPAPEFSVESDTHNTSYSIKFDFPYAIVKSKDNHDIKVAYDEPLNLWANHTKNIEILSTGGSVLALPKEVESFVIGELYDYPYIATSKNLVKSKPLDIVFLSNGEKCAEENYKHLLKITKNIPNRVVRVDGVNGRVQAYHAAAEASNTSWMFTVFAKLRVDEDFDFSWQPDRLQSSKHYIFKALNPVNGLVYGHQAMIAYNKKLTLHNKGRGLDFTLDDPHESVDMLSGVANFNTDPYSTWRTAFREVIKLKSDYESISAERLKVWLTKAEGDFAEYCLRGANDAVEYYNEVGGDTDRLKLSYEWEWLSNYYKQKYN